MHQMWFVFFLVEVWTKQEEQHCEGHDHAGVFVCVCVCVRSRNLRARQRCVCMLECVSGCACDNFPLTFIGKYEQTILSASCRSHDSTTRSTNFTEQKTEQNKRTLLLQQLLLHLTFFCFLRELSSCEVSSSGSTRGRSCALSPKFDNQTTSFSVFLAERSVGPGPSIEHMTLVGVGGGGLEFQEVNKQQGKTKGASSSLGGHRGRALKTHPTSHFWLPPLPPRHHQFKHPLKKKVSGS